MASIILGETARKRSFLGIVMIFLSEQGAFKFEAQYTQGRKRMSNVKSSFYLKYYYMHCLDN